jgi:hypothetical protein
MLTAIVILSMCFGLVTTRAALSIVLTFMNRAIRTEAVATVASSEQIYENESLRYTAPAA